MKIGTRLVAFLFIGRLCAFPDLSCDAGSATWDANPGSGDWNTAANWSPETVPNGSTDIASFAVSSTPGVSISTNTEVNSVVFGAGASGFTIAPNPGAIFTISGAGVINNSGVMQNFSVGGSQGDLGVIQLTNSASVGSPTTFTTNGGEVNGDTGGMMQFHDNSTAGTGTFITNGGISFLSHTDFFDTSTADHGTFVTNGGGAFGGFVDFYNSSGAGYGRFTVNGAPVPNARPSQLEFWDTSTADHALIVAKAGPVQNQASGVVYFIDNATAGSATIVSEGSSSLYAEVGFIIFIDSSTAGNSTLIASAPQNGALYDAISFNDDSTGGSARVRLSDAGSMGLEVHNPPGMTIGSLEGNGYVFLGPNNLTVGSNNLNTTFSGIITNEGYTGGSLTKIGQGRLTLAGGNTYTDGTRVNQGMLLVTNRKGSATGGGPVQVNGGTFGGPGKVTGPVTVGSATTRGFITAHGEASPGILRIVRSLTLNSLATFAVALNSSERTNDQVRANGVTLYSGAQVSVTDFGSASLVSGTVLTLISNTESTPIAGVFSNLPDGSTITVGTNTFVANYEGGDGNDLTLTVQ